MKLTFLFYVDDVFMWMMPCVCACFATSISAGASPVRDDAPRAFMRCARHGAEGRRPQDADMRGMVLSNVREDALPDGVVQTMRVLHPLRQGREQRKGVRAHCILYGLRQHHL